MTPRLTMPRTIRHDCPPGSLLKGSVAHRAMNRALMAREPAQQDQSHLAAVRVLPCIKCGLEPCGEAAHVRMNSAAYGKRQAIGKKPGSEWTIPLCRACHLGDADSQHKLGEAIFWDHLGINPLHVCRELAAHSPNVTKMRAVVLSYFAERK